MKERSSWCYTRDCKGVEPKRRKDDSFRSCHDDCEFRAKDMPARRIKGSGVFNWPTTTLAAFNRAPATPTPPKRRLSTRFSTSTTAGGNLAKEWRAYRPAKTGTTPRLRKLLYYAAERREWPVVGLAFFVAGIRAESA